MTRCDCLGVLQRTALCRKSFYYSSIISGGKGDALKALARNTEQIRSIAVALAALFAESAFVIKDFSLKLVMGLLIRDILLVIREEGLPIDLAKWDVVFLVKIL